MKISAITLAILVLLSGCGKEGIGVSVENSGGSSVETKSGLSWLKEISSGSNTKSTISMPASALISDAMRDVIAFEGDSTKNIVQKYYNDASTISWTPLKSVRFMKVENLGALNDLAELKRELSNPEKGQKSISSLILKCVELGISEKRQEAVDCMNGYYIALSGAKAITVANMPLNGWPVDPYSTKAIDYLVAMSVNTEYANFVATELAARLQGRILRDPQDAKDQITAALFAIPEEKFSAFSSEANKIATNALSTQLSIDAATGKGVSWVANGIKYSNPGPGWTVVRNGVTWFGEGKLSGKSYDLALESSVSATRTTRDQTDQSVGTSSQSSTKGNVGVK